MWVSAGLLKPFMVRITHFRLSRGMIAFLSPLSSLNFPGSRISSYDSYCPAALRLNDVDSRIGDCASNRPFRRQHFITCETGGEVFFQRQCRLLLVVDGCDDNFGIPHLETPRLCSLNQ